MRFESSVEINASASAVWDVYADVERWPEWTESMKRVVALDGPGLEIGKRFEIEQPRLPRLVWEVTDLEKGRSWRWRHRSPGATTVGFHEVVPVSAERTLVRQGIEQRGPLGVVVGLLTGRLTRRYIEMEARGLRARVEQSQPAAAPPA